MNAKSNEQYAYFTVTGEFDPEEITKIVQTNPTKFWKKGDLNLKNGIERKFSRWCLYSRLAKDEDLEKHIDDVIIQLDECSEEVKNISEKYNGYIQLVGYFFHYYPGFYLKSELIIKIAEYKLSIDFDFYYLYSDEEDT